MGYSPPKKQLDLKEFLSRPAKGMPRRGFGYRKPPTQSAFTSESAAARALEPTEKED